MTYLRIDLKRFSFEVWLGFWLKQGFGLREAWGGKVRENGMCLKICHISPIKRKTRVFHGLPSREVTCEKYLWSTKLFTGRLYSWDSRESFCLKFCVFTFCINSFFAREVFSRELLAKIPLKKFLMKHMKNVIKQKLKTQKYKNTFKNI